MALRYAAILPASGPEPWTQSRPATDGFHLVLDHRRVRVFADHPAGAQCIPFRDGLILGRLFSRDRFAQVNEIDDAEARLIMESAGQRLIERYWGGYIAILVDTNGGAVHILRDPSGTLPCYLAPYNGGQILGSDMTTLLSFDLPVPGIDWNYIAYHLASGGLETHRTGLLDIQELLRGTRATFDAGKIHVAPCWDPWSFIDTKIPITGAAAAAYLRDVVSRSVAAWGSCFDQILLSVSGGLDSSIVAACLYGRKTSQCLTMVTQDPEGDEREYARIVAKSLGWPLHEEFYDLDQIDLTCSNAAHLPRPVGRPFAQQWEGANQRIGAAIGADAYFNGNGGDNVFCLAYNVAPAVDRWLTSGFSRDFWNTARDLSRVTGASLIEICKAVRRRLGRKDNRVRWHWDSSLLLTGSLPDMVDHPDHPWLSPPTGVLPGKAAHVMNLLRVHGALDGYERSHGPVIAPLLAQPIVENCLAIPTWRWCEGGHNRSVAREAFSGHLPASILTRRSKGGPESFSIALFERNREAIRDHVVYGMLAQNCVIDKSAAGKLLEKSEPLKSEEYLRLLAFNDTERWVQHWSRLRG